MHILEAIDILLIDNFEYLNGKPQTQKAFANFILKRQVNSKRTMIASLLSPDVFEQFNYQLIKQESIYQKVKLDYPSYSLKKSIVESYMKTNKLNIPSVEQEELISQASDIPTLNGLLNRQYHLNHLLKFK